MSEREKYLSIFRDKQIALLTAQHSRNSMPTAINIEWYQRAEMEYLVAFDKYVGAVVRDEMARAV